MPPTIEVLFRQALKTFSGRKSEDFKLCQQNFEKLKDILSEVKAEDVKIYKTTMDYVRNQRAPMYIMDVFENDDITIAIFIMKHGVTMPLHDHPGMHGLLKVLQGIVKINSYSIDNDDLVRDSNKEIVATKHPPIVVQKSDPPCVLTPSDRNLHEIECIDGPAAFLDVLSPRYDADMYGNGPRPCTFFKQASIISNEKNLVKLVITLPKDLYTARLKYMGSPLR